MKEDFLHFIWKNKLFNTNALFTNKGEGLTIVHPGFHNLDSGPDFFDAKIKIGDITWVGNVEIHSKSSDWYVHRHEKDPAYDNVILHVVEQDDLPVYNSNNNQIPTFVITKHLDLQYLKNFNNLIKNKSILRCQNKLKSVDSFVIINFKYKLFFERLEQKNAIIKKLLSRTHNDWNVVLYKTLLKYFGGTVNKEAFEQLANLLPYKIFKKYSDDPFKLEALLFGVGGLLNENKPGNPRYCLLRKEYRFLKAKHQLSELKSNSVRFHRLRPIGFPTIRLAQFAMLYHRIEFLFEKLMNIEHPEEAYELLQITADKYWDTHYNFDKLTKTKKKTIGKDFIDRILINVVVPLKFAYQKHLGLENTEKIVEFIEQIKPEKNRIVDIFHKIELHSQNALDSQAIIQLNENYCKPERCLQCEFGQYIIKNSL